MGIFFTLAGIIIAVSLFLYFINAIEDGKRILGEKISNPEDSVNRNAALTKNGITHYTKKSKIHNLSDEIKKSIPGRRCPLCSTTLTRDEPLYASHVETYNERKVLIHGCPYCYKNKNHSSKEASISERTLDSSSSNSSSD